MAKIYKSRDLKILYPFGSDISINYPEDNPELYFHCSCYGKQIYLKKIRSLYQVCIYHFYNHLLPRTRFYDDDYLVAHRDDIIPIYETKDFKEAQEKFYECAFRLLCDSEGIARYVKSDGKGYFYI